MQYVGITAGPIAETMAMTATPAGLWFASYFFSTIIRDICRGLQDCGREILTLPKGYRVEEHMEDHGIGTYHDRIYYVAEASPEEIQGELEGILDRALGRRAEEITDAVRQGGAEGLQEDVAAYLRDFLQIHYVIFPEEAAARKGIARTLADALDGAELAGRSCLLQERSYLREMMRGSKDGSNLCLRRYRPLADAASDDAFPLAWRDGDSIRIRSLQEIARGRAGGGHGAKTRNYFAIVQCDGDAMGKAIACDGDMAMQRERIQEFSRLCMEYTTSSARLVAKYGGVTIYAGGDDLLFLAPVQGAGGDACMANVWELCREIGRNFDRIFRASPARPSISVGMSIQYHKFPLYEAFRDARRLLFGVAKQVPGKNSLAVCLRKHSGQSIELACRMETASAKDSRLGLYDMYLDFLRGFCQGNAAEDADLDQLMHSAIYHLEEQRALFQAAMGSGRQEALRCTFENAFDHPGQAAGQAMLEQAAVLAAKVQEAQAQQAVSCKGGRREGAASLDVLASMLRLAKFLVEEERS